MFKPVHGLKGTLVTGITDFGTTLILDNEALAMLRSRVPSGDHTYLLLRQAYDYEIVRTVVIEKTYVTVIRAQDGTTAQAFLSGTVVEFVLSEQAIEEIITDKALGEIEITGGGIVTVEKLGTNTYKISAPAIALTSEDDSIIVGGEFPNYVISAPIKSDCCD